MLALDLLVDGAQALDELLLLSFLAEHRRHLLLQLRDDVRVHLRPITCIAEVLYIPEQQMYVCTRDVYTNHRMVDW